MIDRSTVRNKSYNGVGTDIVPENASDSARLNRKMLSKMKKAVMSFPVTQPLRQECVDAMAKIIRDPNAEPGDKKDAANLILAMEKVNLTKLEMLDKLRKANHENPTKSIKATVRVPGARSQEEIESDRQSQEGADAEE